MPTDLSPSATPEPERPGPSLGQRFSHAQRIVIVLCVASWIIGAMGYHVLTFNRLSHSALMFMGIPTVLAILLCFAPPSQSITGGIMKSITFAMLVIAPLLGEGYLCILFASPIFYLVGAVIGVAADSIRAKRRTTVSCVAILLLPMCMEGVTPQWSLNRTQTVEAGSVVAATTSEIEQTLAHSPDISEPLPRFLRIGFPHPMEAHGEGLEPGDVRTIRFSGAEGDPPGDLVLRVTGHHPGYIRFETVSDSSKLTQWIAWRSSEVSWHAIDSSHTQVTWRIQFDRQLDPAWYFAPWERLAVGKAAEYLLRANTTPNAMHP